MVKESTAAPESALKKPLTRTQSIGILGGFGALLLGLAVFAWFRQSNGSVGPPPKPVEMPAVISQGPEELKPLPRATPNSHEAAVRQETLQAMADQARSAPVEN